MVEKPRITTIAECEALYKRLGDSWFGGEKWSNTWLDCGDDTALTCDAAHDERDEDGCHDKNDEDMAEMPWRQRTRVRDEPPVEDR